MVILSEARTDWGLSPQALPVYPMQNNVQTMKSCYHKHKVIVYPGNLPLPRYAGLYGINIALISFVESCYGNFAEQGQ
jgi:hypothetical protein